MIGPAVTDSSSTAATRAARIRESLPAGGLFADQHWRIAPDPFLLDATTAKEIESLGRVLLQFYRAVNLLYRQSVAGRQPEWVAAWLDQGKPEWLVQLQRAPAFKNAVPRVIRPDVLLTDNGLTIVELDSVPGGIGLTAWLNQTYAALPAAENPHGGQPPPKLLGGAEGMLRGFASIFGDAERASIVVSEEAATYRPEMEWVCAQLDSRFIVRDAHFADFAEGESVYRFFELFDVPNVPSAARLFELAEQGAIRLTPPPKPIFEEKMLFALLWNRNLRGFWRQELGEAFLQRLQNLVPYSWLVDPTPLPPQGAIPELNLTDWQQLKLLSQRERELILKISGFSEKAWGARGVFLGSDLSVGDWSAAVDEALRDFGQSPYVLQRYHKPRQVETVYFDFAAKRPTAMPGRVRLCPYYFVTGENDSARATLGGVLATICPADKKIIHGMTDAVLAPCAA